MRMNCENWTWSKAEQCNRKDYPTFVWYLFKYLPVLWKIFYHLLLVQTIHLPYAIRFLTMEIHTQEMYAVGLASGTLHYFKEICLSWRKLLSFKKKDVVSFFQNAGKGKLGFFCLEGSHTKHIVQAHYTWKIGFEVMTWSHRSSNDGTRRPKNLLGNHSSFLWKKLPGRGHVVIIWVSDLKKAVSSFVYVWAANFEYYSLTA